MGETQSGVNKHLETKVPDTCLSSIKTDQAVSYEEFFSRNFGAGGVKKIPWKISSGAQWTVSYDPRVFFKKIFLVIYAAYFVVREEGMG